MDTHLYDCAKFLNRGKCEDEIVSLVLPYLLYPLSARAAEILSLPYDCGEYPRSTQNLHSK